jgi:hypothetical protein
MHMASELLKDLTIDITFAFTSFTTPSSGSISICRRNMFPVSKGKGLGWANGIRFFQDKDRKQGKR